VSQLLTLRDVKRWFGALKAVDGVSLELEAGEILAIIGPNGAGKTTLFNLISGKLRCTAGAILLDSADITRSSVSARTRMGVAATFQIPRMLGSLTVREVLHAALRYGRAQREVDRPALDLCRRFGLDPDSVCSKLDLHQLKRLEMCRAVAVGARVVLLDEVAAGLDDTERRDISVIIKGLADRGLGVIVVEHTMDFIRGVCGRAVVLDFGRVLASGSVDQVLENEKVINAYVGQSYASA
jgi:branched-chain amino acid transport system ATP-binding protein